MPAPVRVLFLTHRLPFAPNRGDRLRAWHILAHLRAEGCETHVVSLAHDRAEAQRSGDLGGLTASVRVAPLGVAHRAVSVASAFMTDTPLTHALLHSRNTTRQIASAVGQHAPDVVLAYCSSMARYALEPPLAGRPLVIDMVDADSAKWADLGDKRPWPLSWVYAREARLLGAFEAVAMRTAGATLAVNERERQMLADLAPDARIEVVPNGVDLERFLPEGPPAARAQVVFTGVMDYAPNVEGALWLGQHVWPLVRATRPDARLEIVGANPARAVRSLHAPGFGIEVTGTVPDVRPHVWGSAVAAAPLHTARGVQNKVLEAVAAGLPCVVTTAVWEGLPDEVRPACTLADTPQAFADAVLGLLAMTPPERRAIANRANLAQLRWQARLATLVPILREAARRPEGLRYR